MSDLAERVQNLPIEIRYKIMSELPYDKLYCMSNKTLWNVYNAKWPHEKWDPYINWMDALLGRDSWLKCRDKFPVRLPWMLYADWRAINKLKPTKPIRDPVVFTYPKDVWRQIFTGDKAAYSRLLKDMLMCCRGDTYVPDLAELEAAFKTAVAAIYAADGEKRDTYLWMYLEMLFTGEEYIYEPDEVPIVLIKDLLRDVTVSTVIKRYLRFKYDVPDPLIYVATRAEFYWHTNYNIDKNTVVLTLLPYLKKDITPFGTSRLPGEPTTIGADKIRQFYAAISRAHW